jgi:hypothetical protein
MAVANEPNARLVPVRRDSVGFGHWCLYGSHVRVAATDWQAIGAVATGIAALVTAAMAMYTRTMARATKRMADVARDQMGLLTRQADAAEATALQGQRQLDTSTLPVLRLSRLQGENAHIACGADSFGVMVRNQGPVAATVLSAEIRFVPEPFHIAPVPGGAIEPGEERYLESSEAPYASLAAMVNGQTRFEIALAYEGPHGSKRFTMAFLRTEDGGENWKVIEREKDTAEEYHQAPVVNDRLLGCARSTTAR